MSGWPIVRASILASASGALIALASPPFGYYWLMWGALLPLLYVLDTCSDAGSAATAGATTGLSLGLAINYGLLGFDGRLFVYVLGTVTLLLAGTGVAYVSLQTRRPAAMLQPLVLPALWSLAEWVSTQLQVPWAVGLALAPSLPVIQSASLVGLYGVSFVVVLGNVALFEAIRSVGQRRRESAVAALVATTMVGASCLYGVWSLHERGSPPTVRVAVVQPNIATEVYRYQGLNPAYRRLSREVVRDLSQRAAAARPDLLVWSEGANGHYNFRIPELRREIADLARASGATLLAASYDLDERGRLFNSVFAVSSAGRIAGRYDKTHLTPIGESQFDVGAATGPLATDQGHVGAMICFESCFGKTARAHTAAGAELLVVSTSDAPFRRSALPLLHGLFAIFRAVENRRPLVQAANTGPSFLVSADGHVVASLPMLTRDVLIGSLGRDDARSVYTRFGDWPFLLGTLGVIAIVARVGRPSLPWRATRGLLPLAAGGLSGGLLVGAGMVMLSLGRITSNAPEPDGSTVAALRALTVSAGSGVTTDVVRSQLQSRANTCGVAALAYLLSYLGIETREDALLPEVDVRPGGVSMADLARVARLHGVDAWGEEQNLAALRDAPKPVIAHVNDDHYVVVLGMQDGHVDVFDPTRGYARLSEHEFTSVWRGTVLVVRFRSLADEADMRK